MGEYLKHPTTEGEEVKIGVCRGREKELWETPFTKEMLIVLKDAGFKDWYSGSFVETKTLDDFIQHYEELNTSFINYRDSNDIVQEYPEYKSLLL